MERSVLEEAIYNRYIVPTRRKRTRLAGLEFELPLVNRKKEPVNFEVIHQVTGRFIDAFSFSNISRDDDGNIYLAVDDRTGDGLSYDCSYNTLEFSFGKEEDMNVLYKRFCQYYTYIQKELRTEGHMLTGMGINPRYAVNQNIPVVSERYRTCGRWIKEKRLWRRTFY